MALKSETQLPPIVGGFTNKMIDDKTSGDEDLEDGEIFDDEDDEGDKKDSKDVTTEDTKQQLNKTTQEKSSEKINANESAINVKENGVKASAITSGSAILSKNDNQYSNNTWRNSMEGMEDVDDKRLKKGKKRKKRRNDEEDNGDNEDGKIDKKKKRMSDKDGDVNKESGHSKKSNDASDEDGEDDDEMLFVRGASPQRHSTPPHRGRHFQDGFQSDGDNDEIDQDFDDEDFDFENDFDELDDDERRQGGPRSNMSRPDRNGRRDRLSSRGKRRGGHAMSGNRKKREENETCIFFMQGKCHKGNECQFSHEVMQHKKQELCKFYLMECCNKKDKCLYMHGEFPCKYFHMGLKCYANKSCRFSHAKLTDSMRQVFIKTFGPIRSKGEFPNKKGPTNKHGRPQDMGVDFNRQREPRGGDLNREKKIPSLFDIKVSIPDEMRKDYNSDSEGGGNRTPMPSPPLMQGQPPSDSSHSPPPADQNGPPSKRRRKEKRGERSSRKGHRDRGNYSDNEGGNNRRMALQTDPGAMGTSQHSNDSFDEAEHQEMLNRLRAEYNSLNDEENSFNNLDSSVSGSDGITNASRGDMQSNRKQQNHYDSDGSDKNSNSTAADSLPLNNPESSTGASHQSGDNSNEMFPAHLPKKQRELFLRIRQQQRQATNINLTRQQSDKDNNEANEEGTDPTIDDGNDRCPNDDQNMVAGFSSFADSNDNKSPDDNKLQADDQNWYSSDEEEYQQSSKTSNNTYTSTNNSISALLQNLMRMNSGATSQGQTQDGFTGSLLSTPAMAGGSNEINSSSIANVDFDVNEVSALLSKVNQNFQTTEKKVPEKRRDPRLRSDVGPSGDNLNGSTNPIANLESLVPASSIGGHILGENKLIMSPRGDDMDQRNNLSGNKGDGAGDMDLRNLPFKPAPVHSAATEIDASINSHQPLPYVLIPIVVPKPDYSSVLPNSKVGAADPRLRKTLRISEDSGSAVSSRDPRHRLIDDISKTKNAPSNPAPVNIDPRQRSRLPPPSPQINHPGPGDDQAPPSLMLPPSLSHVRPSYQCATDPSMMGPPVPLMNEEPLQSFVPNSPMIATTPISRPTDPRQRHSQSNMQLPPISQSQAATLFDVLNAMNSRQPGFLTQTGDPRSRPQSMPNIVFPGAVRSNDSSVNKGQYGFK